MLVVDYSAALSKPEAHNCWSSSQLPQVGAAT